MSRLGVVKRVLHHSGLLALARLARQRVRGVVLRYHAITNDRCEVLYAAPDVCMPLAAFRVQMAFVKRAYGVVPLDAVVDALASRRALPPRALVITFDDGYADNHRLALPVLRALGLPATVYVATGSVGNEAPFWVSAVRALALSAPGEVLEVPGHEPIALGARSARGTAARALARALVPLDGPARAALLEAAAARAGVDVRALLAGTMLTWAQVRELHAAGWTIGAHTVTHSNVALAAPAEAEREIGESRAALERALGAPVQHFCYPNTGGRHRYFSPAVAALLARSGFRSAATSRPGAVEPGTDPFALPRLGVGPRLAPVAALAAALERHRLAA